MHGHSPGSAFLVNAEVDSMGGVYEDGVRTDITTSPRHAAIQKAQAELRLEYDIREDRKRELEFLEKGGNPLDFKFVNPTSVSVQSTSLTDHQIEHVVTSKAKGSIVLTASAHGDSTESNGRPGAPVISEPNSADNFNGENEVVKGEKASNSFGRRYAIPPEQSSHIGRNQDVKESEDSAIFRPYARRNRSRPNRDSIRSSSTDLVQSSGDQGSTLPNQGGIVDTKRPISGSTNQNGQTVFEYEQKLPTPCGNVLPESGTPIVQPNMVVDVVEAVANLPNGELPEDGSAITEPKILKDTRNEPPSHVYTQKLPLDMASGECDQTKAADIERSLCVVQENSRTGSGSRMQNGFSSLKIDGNEVQNGDVDTKTKGSEEEFSCTRNGMSIEVDDGSNMCSSTKNVGANEIPTELALESEGKAHLEDGDGGNENNETKAFQNHTHNSSSEVEEEMQIVSNLQDTEKSPGIILADKDENESSRVGKLVDNVPKSDVTPMESQHNYRSPNLTDFSNPDLPLSNVPEKECSASPDPKAYSNDLLKGADKAHEDSILEEARTIKAKHKRIAELRVRTAPLENKKKCHWDFVLEEMAWLANDFAQERLWKMTAASQIAFNSRFRVEEQLRPKMIAHALAKDVIQFWHSVEEIFKNNDEEMHNDFNSENCRQNLPNAIQGYALRFLKCNPSLPVEAPLTLDGTKDLPTMEISWDDHLREESLFYAVPFGAIETYRRSIEAHLQPNERTRGSKQEEMDTSMHDAGIGFRLHTDAYMDEEGETSTYNLHGILEGSKSTKHEKKQKNAIRSYSGRAYDVEADLPYRHNTIGSQENIVLGKRPGNNLNVILIPPKRVRSAPRQKVLSPFSAGATGDPQGPARSDASSGDTSSLQDEYSTLRGGSQVQNSMEVESVKEHEKQLLYDSVEISTRPKKKKGSAHEPGWQVDSTIRSDQKEHFKKKLESHDFESNRASGLYAQHAAKKPKLMKQLDDAREVSPMTKSIPSPAASQMSNMPNSNKIMRIVVGGRDKGRKMKSLKLAAGQPSLGSEWSLFEDQALVVLVHDMGPNWELVSDCINSTLQFKCVFRKPKECKERHKALMDKGAGDGADSAEDSGSSQSYESTLPGIPKGSARHLFQRLQGPMEEDTLRSHFEKIIMIGKKQHCKQNQRNDQDASQIAPVHNSHIISLSQVFPNNLNRSVLTPLDLCDASPSSQDVLPLEYQGSHCSSISMANHGPAMSVASTSSSNSSLLGSSTTVLGYNSLSPSGQVNASLRQTTAASFATHQQQSNLLADRGVRMLSGGMAGTSRSIPAIRPGLQGLASSTIANPGNMLASGTVGVPIPVTMPGGTGSGQGNSRDRDTLQMIGTAHTPRHQRQGIAADVQMQSYAGHLQQPHMHNNLHNRQLQGTNNSTGAHQQAYAIRFAKERQQQQRLIQQQQQQQQQFPASRGLMQNGQPQSQLPISPPSSQSVSMTQTSSMTSKPAQQQEHNLLHQGLSRNSQNNASGLISQTRKQRLPQEPQQPSLQQQFQQSNQQHQLKQQSSVSPQQSTLTKGTGRGTMAVHHNLSVDRSHLNGLTVTSQNQVTEKSEQIMHLMQGKGFYPGAGLSPIQQSKPTVSPQSTNPSSKQLERIPSHSSNKTQGHAFATANHRQLQAQQKQVSQAQTTVQRMVQQSHQVNSDAAMKPRDQQQPVNSVSPVGTSTAVVVPRSQSGKASFGSPAHTNSAGSEPTAPVGEDLGPRQLAGSLHGQTGGAQWQQKPQHSPLIQKSVTSPIPCQQLFQPQEEQQPCQPPLPLQQQPQQ